MSKDNILDEDDIYFLQLILHDGYTRKKPISTRELAERHFKYHPLKLEIKLDHLAKEGLIIRDKDKSDVLSLWSITQEGIKFMFKNGYELKDLIEDEEIYREF